MRTTAVLSLVLAVSGCGYMFGDKGVFRDRSEDYKKAPQTPPLTVPEGMENVPLNEIYVIPPVQDKFLSQGEFEVPRPVPLAGGAGPEVVRIQKLGDASWVLIGVAPGQVWPQVRNFMAASGMQVARADAEAGLLETNWLTVEGQPGASRFQFRIEQGVQRGTSELYVLQMRQVPNPTGWPAKSDDPAQAADMLQAIAQFLADSAESSPVSMIAEQGITAGGKITMLNSPDDGYNYLQLDLPYDRAWASLGRALEKSAFEITDLDRSGGVYYVRFIGQAKAEEKSWWSSMWSSDEMESIIGQSFVVTVQKLTEQSVSIRLRPQDESLVLEHREDEDLLAMIKGNID